MLQTEVQFLHSAPIQNPHPPFLSRNCTDLECSRPQPLTQLSQLGEKSQQYQRTHGESLHYATLAGARTALPGAEVRGGRCRWRASLNCWNSIVCSAVSAV